jgi:hypothetical protein
LSIKSCKCGFDNYLNKFCIATNARIETFFTLKIIIYSCIRWINKKFRQLLKKYFANYKGSLFYSLIGVTEFPNESSARPFSNPPEVSQRSSLREGNRGLSPPGFSITTIDPELNVPLFSSCGKKPSRDRVSGYKDSREELAGW